MCVFDVLDMNLIFAFIRSLFVALATTKLFSVLCLDTCDNINVFKKKHEEHVIQLRVKFLMFISKLSFV